MKLLNRGEPLFEGSEFHFEMWMDYLNSKVLTSMMEGHGLVTVLEMMKGAYASVHRSSTEFGIKPVEFHRTRNAHPID